MSPPAASWTIAELERAERKREPVLNALLVLLPLQTLFSSSSPFSPPGSPTSPDPSPEPQPTAAASRYPGAEPSSSSCSLSFFPRGQTPSQHSTNPADGSLPPSTSAPCRSQIFPPTPTNTLSSFSASQFSHILPPLSSKNVFGCFF